ncbi:MAG TPA: chloride channel protein, partial [Pirellulales bacterium]
RPDLLGGGHELLVEMLTTAPLLGAVLVIAAARSVLTIAGYASGAAGGLFMPLLVLGACLGASTQALPLPSGVAPAVPVVLGMAALFAGSIRAPATGVLLMIEMTNGYALILPLLVASLAAELTAGELGGRPLYAALRDRDSAAALAGVANPTSPSN